MSDLLGADGKPAAQAPVKVPDHPMIADPKPEPVSYTHLDVYKRQVSDS